jgi:hypothetical protein
MNPAESVADSGRVLFFRLPSFPYHVNLMSTCPAHCVRVFVGTPMAKQKGANMAPALIPAQVTALQNLHKELAALMANEGKGGPVLAPTVAAVQADLLALYQTLLGLTPSK